VLWLSGSKYYSRKHCDFSNSLAKRARTQFGACAEVKINDYGTQLLSPGNRNCSRKTLLFQHPSCQESESSVWRFTEVQFPDYGTVLRVSGSRKVSNKGLRFQHLSCQERELSLEHGQRCSFLIMEQSCGSLTVEMIPGKTVIPAPILPRELRAQSDACAEVYFPEYGTVLWVPGSRNWSRKALRFQHLSCKERELSLEHGQRCSFLIMEQSCGPLSVEIIPG
jgi:hypothetical protein